MKYFEEVEFCREAIERAVVSPSLDGAVEDQGWQGFVGHVIAQLSTNPAYRKGVFRGLMVENDQVVAPPDRGDDGMAFAESVLHDARPSLGWRQQEALDKRMRDRRDRLAANKQSDLTSFATMGTAEKLCRISTALQGAGGKGTIMSALREYMKPVLKAPVEQREGMLQELWHFLDNQRTVQRPAFLKTQGASESRQL